MRKVFFVTKMFCPLIDCCECVTSVFYILRLNHANIVLGAIGAIEADCLASRWIETTKMKTTAKDVTQSFLECFSKFAIEVCVNDRVHGRIKITDPE